MASTSQAMLNQGLFEDQEAHPQVGFFSFPPNMTLSAPPLMGSNCHHQSLKTFTTTIPCSLASDALPNSNIRLSETLLSSLSTSTTTPLKHRDHQQDHIANSDHNFGGPHLLSLQRSSANLW